MAKPEDGDGTEATAQRFPPSDRTGTGRAETAAAQRVSYLDQTLWKQLEDAASPESFASSWLVLQCRMVSGSVRAYVALGAPDVGPYAPLARWPEGDAGVDGLTVSAERALAERRGVIYGHRAAAAGGAPRAAPNTCFAAYPFLIDGQLHGVVALEIADRSERQLRAVMRQLQWGAVWIELLQRRQSAAGEEESRTRTALVLDLVAGVVEEDGFEAACLAAVTEIASSLDCERVSIGFLERGHARVASLSHTARFGKRTSLIRAIGASMDEAIDQRSMILYPPPSDDTFLVTAAHAELHDGRSATTVLTIPFGDRRRYTGAFTFERSAEDGLRQSDIELLDVLASVVGPILAAKRRESRWIVVKMAGSLGTQVKRLVGPRYLGRKLAMALAVACMLLAWFATDIYRVTAAAAVEGLVRRVVVAPFDGYILSEKAHAGDSVKQGDVLAELDIHDLALKRLRTISTRAQRMAEYNQALAERKAADVNVIRAQIEQTDAEIALYDEQIGRARLRAPFDGLVLAGDLSQSVGSSVTRGDVLFEISPLDAYRVILRVDDRQIRDITVGQKGSMLLSALPETPLPITVSAITPVSEAHEGRNLFRVEARLDEAIDRLRPGMEGIAKIEIGERRLIWIWTSPLIDWLRVKLWSWMP